MELKNCLSMFIKLGFSILLLQVNSVHCQVTMTSFKHYEGLLFSYMNIDEIVTGARGKLDCGKTCTSCVDCFGFGFNGNGTLKEMNCQVILPKDATLCQLGSTQNFQMLPDFTYYSSIIISGKNTGIFTTQRPLCDN